MTKYCTPELPEMYWVNQSFYKCENCGNTFEICAPNGNEIVKLREINGSEIRWLPTFNKGGYIDLMTKVIKGHKVNDPINMEKATKFIAELQGYIEKSLNGNGFGLCIDTVCPRCNSKSIEINEENVLVNPELRWLRISCDFLK